MIIRFCALGLLITLLLTSCKVRIEVPNEGKIVSESGAFECNPNQTCTVDIYDIYFDETFKGIPKRNHAFVGWRKVKGGLCPNKASPCRIFSRWAENDPAFMKILESDSMFHLVPVFAKGAGPYGIFRNPVPSGGEDLYQREINWRHGNIPPGAHRFDKAFLLRENIFKADERAYITKLEWWGYYESKDLQDPLKMQKFRIIFYENNGRHPDTVLAKRDVRIKPTVLKYPNSRFRLGKVRSTNPRYDGRQIYGYSMEFGPSLYLKHGDLWLSIVQINEETGESVPEWVILNKGSFSLRQSFLTDYGGWQNASLETHSYVNVYGVILGREQFDHIETMN